jgi:hypothetical protein
MAGVRWEGTAGDLGGVLAGGSPGVRLGAEASHFSYRPPFLPFVPYLPQARAVGTRGQLLHTSDCAPLYTAPVAGSVLPLGEEQLGQRQALGPGGFRETLVKPSPAIGGGDLAGKLSD